MKKSSGNAFDRLATRSIDWQCVRSIGNAFETTPEACQRVAGGGARSAKPPDGIRPPSHPARGARNATYLAPLPGCVGVLPRNRWYRAPRSTTGYPLQRLRRNLWALTAEAISSHPRQPSRLGAGNLCESARAEVEVLFPTKQANDMDHGFNAHQEDSADPEIAVAG